MQVRVLAVGTRMPAWVQTAVADYSKRLPREFGLQWTEVPPAKRHSGSPARYRAQEAEALRRQLKPETRLIALDVVGKPVSTQDIAEALAAWQMDGARVAMVIGGPDGLDGSLLDTATARWSLGRITLPHPLVRVVLAEQLYRAWSVNAGHPYHRA